MTFWLVLVGLALLVLMISRIHVHEWHRPGDDWRERHCLKCGAKEYLILREWLRDD